VPIKIEPLRSGNSDFLELLDELRSELPQGKSLSMAAFPRPTAWHPFREVHWDRRYFPEVARRADQIVVVMYDTAMPLRSVYQGLMAGWTTEVLSWAGVTQVLLGIPACDDAGVAYHYARVENLHNALSRIHRGLSAFPGLPQSDGGVAIYAEREVDHMEWELLQRECETTHELPDPS